MIQLVKLDVSYEIWRQEAISLIDSGVYPDISLLMAFHKLLKGSAADVLLHLGTGITPASCVQKVDTIFGNVLPLGTLLERFWSVRQNQG